MNKWFVSRHQGAIEWSKKHGNLKNLNVVNDLDINEINPGDEVYGTLPVHLVAKVCERGGKYFHLSMNVPQDIRGQELSVDEMQKFNANLKEMTVLTKPVEATLENSEKLNLHVYIVSNELVANILPFFSLSTSRGLFNCHNINEKS